MAIKNPPQVFISYASDDVARAAALHARLTAAVFEVWFDKARLVPGCDWHKDIEAGCEAARVILPLLTPRWQHSPWTKYETYASDAVIPVLAEGKPEAVMPPPLLRWNAHALDPLRAGDAAWESLFSALRAKLAEPVAERAPRILDLPYPANPFFTGRDDDLVRIHEELHQAPVAALTQVRVRALAAMGGVGKTTLANEYARRFWRLYPQILWVDARTGLESGFALLFEKLFPDRASENLKQPDKARLALAELSGKPERLLVIDNVEDAESVRPWLPPDATTGCRTLITSRFSDWPQEQGIRPITLYVLEPEPSRQFLLARTGRTAEGAELAACDALAKALDYLPLALEQAAAYIAAPGAGVGFAGYLRLYGAEAAELLARKALGSTEYPDAVITTWQAIVAKLSPESRAVLRLCAWYAETPIPCALVVGGATEVLALAAGFDPVMPLSGPAAAELRMRDALSGLARYSMILDATDTTFRVHGLVQTVERVRAEQEGRDDGARDRALVRLTAIFPDAFNDPSAWPLCRQLLPHQRALTARLGPDHKNAELPRLLNKAGNFLQDSGDAVGALPLHRRALESNERLLGPDHPDTLTTRNNIAFCTGECGDAREALRLFTALLPDQEQERVVGPNHPDTLRTRSNIAFYTGECGDAREALRLFTALLPDRERVLSPDHPATLTTRNNIAFWTGKCGDAQAALRLFEALLPDRERVLGPDHPDTLTTRNNIASWTGECGDVREALRLFTALLPDQERVLGPDHPDTLRTRSNIASCIGKRGDAREALRLSASLLPDRERVLGSDHPDTLTTRSDIAFWTAKRGDAWVYALLLFAELLPDRERVLGPDHPDTLSTHGDIAFCTAKCGDTRAALRLFAALLPDQERVLGSDHPNTLTTRKWINDLSRVLNFSLPS